jgi:ankyrin repeat protein
MTTAGEQFGKSSTQRRKGAETQVMKTFIGFVVMLAFALHAGAADALTEKLQRGLFEEEANHNLDAAIKEYQSVVAQADEQRKVMATALFRLGECYRKLGKTNEANAQYERVVRDFSEQEALVKLSRELLPRSNTQLASTTPVTDPVAVSLLREEIRVVEQSVQSGERMLAAGRINLSDVLNAKKEVLRLKRQLPENAASSQQRALLEEQIGIVKQHLSHFARLAPDRLAPGEELPIQRELLSLQRELAAVGDVAKSFAGEPSAGNAPTQAEAEALARVKTLARNSPDLLQNPGKDGWSELQVAAREGYYSVVEFILSQRVNPNGPERSSPPVQVAANRGHLRIVELLLDRGADVNREDGYGKSALILAAQQGFKSVVELLLARGANVNYPDNEQRTALIYATQNGFTSVAELLLERGADPNKTDNRNATALHYAAVHGHAAIARLLLEKKAKPDVLSADLNNIADGQDPQGWRPWPDRGATPLHLASVRGFAPIVQELLSGGAPAISANYAKVTPLHLAAERGGANICALLLQKGADPNVEDFVGNTPFSRAIDSGRAETVGLLIAKGAEVNRPIIIQGSQNHPQYPLHLAIYKPLAVLEAVLQGKPDLEVVNKSDRTPLRQAAEQNKTEMVEKLLAVGANPNRRTSAGEALFAAVYQNSPKPELVAMLLKHGANPNIVSGGQTPLAYAESRSKGPRDPGAAACEQIATLLRQHGANEYLQRLSAITYTRPTWTSGERAVFYRGTNDYNRFTLFEFLANVFVSPNAPAFPDFARVTLERLEGTNPRPREISLNVEELLRATNCAKNMWLEWGDRVSIPEVDHALNEPWHGLHVQTRELLSRCLERRIHIIVKQETNSVRLVQDMDTSTPGDASLFFAPSFTFQVDADGGVALNQADAATKPKPEKTLAIFRLKEVVYGANVLRASSDPTRARVTRVDRTTGKTNQWTIDLTQVATTSEWADNKAKAGKLWNQHDLWLRDGDVIEIPEKP